MLAASTTEPFRELARPPCAGNRAVVARIIFHCADQLPPFEDGVTQVNEFGRAMEWGHLPAL